ncbi:uncharacterized protein LOC112554421 [Pomacea canaliculata]|uniref:uncharacterized protein LOC112554421 n=1 Tax=Pomacea canaliculata TaxID=400727 RepID=UPI000D73BE25|nr:uncharacterized protein LOC112554421 [Pomacea canaliculata]
MTLPVLTFAVTVVMTSVHLVSCHETTKNFLVNPSFEDAKLEPSWSAKKFQMQRNSEMKKHGNYSLLCTGRTNPNAGPQQHIRGLVPGGRYALHAYVRLLEDKPGRLWQTFKAVLTFYFDGAETTASKVTKRSCKGLKKQDRNKCQADKKKTKKEKKKKKTGKKEKNKKNRKSKKNSKQRDSKDNSRSQILQRRATKPSSGSSPDKRRGSGDDEENGYIIAWRPFVTASKGWIPLIGDLNAPMKNITGARLSIQGPDAGLDFLLDDLVLYEVPEHPDWATEALVRIDKHRKSNVQLQVRLPSGVNPADIEIQVDQKKHLFAFGSKVADDVVRKSSEGEKRFQDIFYYLFNWATVGSYKWRFDKGTPENPDFSNALEATEVLLRNGIKVRGHSILWGVKKNIPDWVTKLEGNRLREELVRRATYVTNITRGRLAHWDVQNEFLHGQYYEETLQDPNVTMEMFKLVKRLDPVPKLYLNDFQAVTVGGNTEAYHDLAEDFKAAGTGIQGLGIQGHTKDFVKPDPTMIWRRLDKLAETGLELFMTEFDLGWPDEVVRADWLEDAIRAFFAHPGLSGVILWDIWDLRQRYPDKGLLTGQELKFIEPGQRFACLVKKEWSTHVTWRLSDSNQTLRLRAFQGLYDVVVKKRGVPVQKLQMSLGKQDVVYHINVTARNVPIKIPVEHDFVPQCVSHRDQRSLGVATTYVTDSPHSCLQRIAKVQRSAGYMTQVSVTCEDGYVMTDCSSYLTALDLDSQVQLSDNMAVINGSATCTAYLHGMLRSAADLVATAQCCHLEGLTCDYRVAGPSAIFDGARAEAVCPSGYFPFGCSAYSRWSHHAGVMPSGTSCVAQSGPPSTSDPAKQSGVIVTAACCRGGVRCLIVQSDFGKEGYAQVTCPPSHVMTGCSAFAVDGKFRGARTESSAPVCTATSGTAMGVIAYATCCTD